MPGTFQTSLLPTILPKYAYCLDVIIATQFQNPKLALQEINVFTNVSKSHTQYLGLLMTL